MADVVIPDKMVADAFELIYPNARSGPAGDFLKEPTDGNLDKAIAMADIAMLNRRGLNPYRDDLMDKAMKQDMFAGMSDNEIDATRNMLGTIKSMRVQMDKMKAKSVVAKSLPTAVKAPAIIEKVAEVKDAGNKVEAKPEAAKGV